MGKRSLDPVHTTDTGNLVLNKVRKKDTLGNEYINQHQDDEEEEKGNHHWIVHILHRWLEHVPSTHHSGSRDDSKIGQTEEILAQSIILPVPRYCVSGQELFQILIFYDCSMKGRSSLVVGSTRFHYIIA